MPESDGLNRGGDGGGVRLVLTRSELEHLRTHADLIPFGAVEREEIAQTVMHTLRVAKSPRLKLAAAKTAGALLNLNLKEVEILLRAKGSGEVPSVNVNVTATSTVNIVSAAVQEALKSPEYLEYLESRELEDSRIPSPVREDGGTGVENDAPPDPHFPRIGPSE